MVTYLV